MRRLRSLCLFGAAHLAVLMLPAPLCAQEVTGGLFGATRSDTVQRDRLDAMVTVSEAWDSHLPPLVANEFPQGPLQSGGLSTMVFGTAEYAHTRRRARILANGESIGRYYNNLNQFDVIGLSGAFGADLLIADNTNVVVSQTAAYSPSYLYHLFPTVAEPELGDLIPVAPDYELLRTDSYIYRSNVELAAGSARSARFTASGGYDRTDFRGALAGSSSPLQLELYHLGAGVERAVRRNGRLSANYEYRHGDFGLGLSTEHRVAFGTEYSRALSRKRRATFQLEIAPSTLTVPNSALTIPNPAPTEPTDAVTADRGAASEPSGTQRLYRLQADAAVEYQVHLRWLVSGAYRRGIEYLSVFAGPVLSDGARISVEGLITSRLDLLATAAYVSGASALDQLSHLDSSTANVRLRYALSRTFAAYGEYIYFLNDFGDRRTLAPHLPRVFNQHGIRGGIMLRKQLF